MCHNYIGNDTHAHVFPHDEWSFFFLTFSSTVCAFTSHVSRYALVFLFDQKRNRRREKKMWAKVGAGTMHMHGIGEETTHGSCQVSIVALLLSPLLPSLTFIVLSHTPFFCSFFFSLTFEWCLFSRHTRRCYLAAIASLLKQCKINITIFAAQKKKKKKQAREEKKNMSRECITHIQQLVNI